MKYKEFERPAKTGYTIYVVSNCPYCNTAKELVKEIENKTIINCDEYIKYNDKKFYIFINEITGKKYDFMPILFIDGIYMGGYNELETIIDNPLIKIVHNS